MHQAREILRQKLALGRSHRQIAASLGVSASTVSTVVGIARALGLDGDAIEKLTDAELEDRLHPNRRPRRSRQGRSPTARRSTSSCVARA